jgi:hypothetical protein
MTQRRKSVDWGKVAAGAGLLALGGTAYYYLRDGAGAKNTTALLPKSLEDRLDRVVETLNQNFDERWVNMGLDFLQTALAKALPPPLIGLIEFIMKAEHLGIANEWSGPQKRAHAANLATS